MNLRGFVILIFAGAAVGLVHAQTPYFTKYDLLRKGEPVRTSKIFQDSRGYMCFGTNKGLFRFDGTNQLLIDGTVTDPVTALGEDKTGKIWAGTRSGHLGFIEPNLKLTP